MPTPRPLPTAHLCALLIVCLPAAVHAAVTSQAGLADLTIEELSQIVVTSVSRNPEPISRAPASVYVVTGEEIARAGATTLPEALRLAPNLQVARIDAGQYAITARGFNSSIANKLLVLIDGRTVYSPLFSGVFWDAQTVMLEDVARIEVIDGPGAATWGINAVNGVINVITRSAENTQGMLIKGASGSHDRLAAVRYGGRVGANGFFRVYGKGLGFEATHLRNGASGQDAWHRGEVGFRADWAAKNDTFMVAGDFYKGETEDRPIFGRLELAGGHVLGEWTRTYEDGSRLEVQAFYDRTDRTDRFLLQEESDLADIEVRHSIAWRAHRLQWGVGYRHAWSRSDPGVFFAFVPANRELEWYHLFLQDRIALTRSVELTLGTRFEHNDYTGWEILPTMRLGWQPHEQHLVWGSVSRAVRAPARLDREIHTPPSPPFIVAGGPDFDSEVTTVYELGYRVQPLPSLSLSVTAFHHRYDRLRGAELAPGGGFFIDNEIEGEVQGLEFWGRWQVSDSWRLAWGAMALDKDLRLIPGSTDPTGPSNLGNDPEHEWMLRSTYDLTDRHAFDVTVRRIGELSQPEVPAYTAVDVRFGWQVLPDVELSLLLENLLDREHVEFGDGSTAREIERSARLTLVWRR